MRRGLAALIWLLAARSAAAFDAPTNYALHCQGCHLADGTGTPGKVPALAGALGPFLRVDGGRAFLARVPGVANAPIDDAELATLLNWTLARFDAAALPGDFAPYTAEEVGRLRAQPLVDVTAERTRLLAAEQPN